MSITKPYFKLYSSDGTTLLYTFPIVQETNAPQTPRRVAKIEGMRGKGALIIDGGEPTWDLFLRGVLVVESDEGYEEITAKIDELESAIAVNTPYILRIDKTASTYYEYKVKRIVPINYDNSFRTESQKYEVILLVNCW